MTSLRHRALSLLTLALAAPGTLTVPAALLLASPARAQEGPERDDPKGRRKERLEWEGEWSPAYRRFLMEAAGRERVRYAALMPKAGQAPLAYGVVAQGTQWISLGPTNADVAINGGTQLAQADSGRGTAIAVHPTDPKRIYFATSGGGLWRSLDGGATWATITDTLGSLSVGALALDPSNPNILYLGLGDAFDGTGLGLLKSTDGGDTWSAPIFLGTSRVINHIAISSKDPKVVLVATNQGLFRSADAGATFAPVSINGATPYTWVLAPAGAGAWALAGQPAQVDVKGQVWTSQDDGLTWSSATGIPATGIDRISLASAPGNPQVMYAMAADGQGQTADLFRSTDGGRGWTSLAVGAKSYTNANLESAGPASLLGGQGWYNHTLLVDPLDANHAYFGGQLLLMETKDGGQTFTQLTNWLAQYGLPYVHADFHAGAFDGSGNLYVGTDGGLFRSADRGLTWANLNKGITSHLIYSVGTSLTNRDAILGGFQDNGTRVRSGATSTFDQTLGGDGFGSHIHALDAKKMIGSLYYTRLKKSTDGGATWMNATTGITEAGSSGSAPFRTRLVPDLADASGNTLYTFTNSKVYKSTTYGDSWAALGTTGLPTSSFAIRNLAVCKADPQALVVAANAGQIYLTANGGASWTKAGALPNSGGWLSAVWIDSTSKSTVYACTVEADATKNHLWKSTDFGSSWTAIDGAGFPTGTPVNLVKNDPQDPLVLYAGTHLGLYRSSDGGATWNRFGVGLPLVSVTDIYVAPDSSLVRVATFGRGFWELLPPPPSADITAAVTTPATDVSVASGASVSFAGTGSSAKGATLSYDWSFGDGGTASGATASHAFTNTANTDATLTVTFRATAPDGSYGLGTRRVTVLGDHVAPSVSVAAAAGTGGSFTFTATASDNIGVKAVDFYVDGTLVGTGATAGTYTLTLATLNLLTNGAHAVVAKATDLGGNATSSAPASFTVANTYGATILFETEPNDALGTANAPDSKGTLLLGTLATESDADYYAFTLKAGGKLKLDLDGLRSGALDYDLYLLDASGAELAKSDSPKMTESITYTNSDGAPKTVYAKVATYAPTTGGPNASASFHYSLKPTYLDVVRPTVSDPVVTGASGPISFAATAADDTAVAKVEFLVDGVVAGSVATPTAGQYVLNLDSSTLANGTHAVVARATDPSGNAASSHAVPFGVQNAAFELLKNGSFEQQMASWTNSNWYASTLSPRTGAYVGSSFSSYAATSLSQKVTIPANATAASLSFWFKITTAETGTVVKDTLKATLKDASGNVLATLKTLSNLDKTSSWVQVTADLGAYAGQAVTLAFEATQDGVSSTFFSIDDVSLKATVPLADAEAPALSGVAVSGTSGPITFSATATDNVGVAKVGFYVDGALMGTQTTGAAGIYTLGLDALFLGNGPHALIARAFDAAGNVTASAPVAFTISDTFTELLANPGFEQAFANWTQTNWAVGTDPVTRHGGAKYAMGNVLTSGGTLLQKVAIPANARAARFSWWVSMASLFTNKTTPGDTLAVTVTDDAGTVLATKSFTNLDMPAYQDWVNESLDLTAFKGRNVTVNFTSTLKNFFFFYLDDTSLQAALPPDAVPPVVGAPSASGASGTVDLKVTATDDVALAKVEFLVDGALAGTATAGAANAFTLSLDTLTLANGAHTLAARATDQAGNATTSATASFTVTNTAPVFTSQPQAQVVTEGQAASFTVEASGPGTLAYQWTRNGAPVSGATAASYTTGTLALADDGARFAVVVTNPVGSTTSQDALLTVKASLTAPAITGQPQSQTALEGSTAAFTVTATGTGPLAYQWMKNGAPLTGATAATYTTPALALADGGSSFTVSVSNAAGGVSSSAALLTVQPQAGVTLVLNRAKATLLPGGRLSVTATVQNTANTAVIWAITEAGGGTVDAASANPVTYTAPRAPGLYHLVATSVADPSRKATVLIRVYGQDPNGALDAADLAALADAWGTSDSDFDLNQDGLVDDLDLNLLLNAIQKG